MGLEPYGDGRWAFEAVPALCRYDGRFYGGTAIAVACVLMEEASGRPPVWVTVQFIAGAAEGEVLDCRVSVLAEGRRASQLQVTGAVGDRTVFVAMGAVGEAVESPIETHFGPMPAAPDPESCPGWTPHPALAEPGLAKNRLTLTDPRIAGQNGSVWTRMPGMTLTRAGVAFLADILPSGVVRAAGRTGAGTSLDNTVRFGPEPTGEWMLVDVDPQLISGGYVHGGARLWTASGVLVGTASQTARLMLFD